MRRENKIALIIGFSVLLVVAVLVSDHLSQAPRDEVRDGLDTLAKLPEDTLFFETPLSASRRAAPAAPAAPAETVAAETAPPALSSAEPSPKPAAPVISSPGTASEPIVARLPDHTETLKPVATPSTHPDPVVVSNGPAAHRLAATTSTGRHSRSDLLGIDPSQIRALLETARAKSASPESGRASGLVASARKYVVQHGDTLYEICQRLYGDGERWHELAARNKGKVGSNGTVYVGVTLDLMPGARGEVRDVRSGTRSGAAKTNKQTPTARSGHTRKYVVKKGDTLSQIAQREVGSVRFLDEIRGLNPSLKKNRDRIFVGQVLVLPSPRG
ncbi:MAG TPA: LysM peptidoglycan-binding domain-containing protein [Phycisphaerales bacterium]|nr:LysM peptidoglycan-binding domain-containing protein [Phycisphaerales bacterium]